MSNPQQPAEKDEYAELNETTGVSYHLTSAGKFAVLLMFGEVLVFSLTTYVLNAKIGLGTCICLATVATALWMKWSDQKRMGFRIAAFLALPLQYPVIRFFPWGNRDDRVLVLPIAVCDFAIVWVALTLGAKLWNKSEGNPEHV